MNNSETELFIAQLEHPLKAIMLQLRNDIIHHFPNLQEIIKWNAPSYQHNGIDFLTFNLSKKTDIKLIFHRGAKTKEVLSDTFIKDESGLLQWAANDRAIVTFTTITQSNNQKEALQNIIQKWTTQL